LKLSLLVSTVGLGMLFYVSITYEESVESISQLDYDSVGNRVAITGEILSKSTHKEGHIFLKVGDSSGWIRVALFDSYVERLSEGQLDCLRVGGSLWIRGRVEEYRGSLEIVPRQKEDLRCSTSYPSP
jgi:DNA/RNA endonuclease YhcR with UshA esterase domain